jgi:hypothetical protein
MTRADAKRKLGRRGLLARRRPHKPKSGLSFQRPRPAVDSRVVRQLDRLEERKQNLRARLAAFQVVADHLGATMETIRTAIREIEELEKQ